jgi:hypothetical protein
MGALYIAQRAMKIGEKIVNPGELVDVSGWSARAIEANLSIGRLEKINVLETMTGLEREELRTAVLNSKLPDKERTRIANLLSRKKRVTRTGPDVQFVTRPKTDDSQEPQVPTVGGDE